MLLVLEYEDHHSHITKKETMAPSDISHVLVFIDKLDICIIMVLLNAFSQA